MKEKIYFRNLNGFRFIAAMLVVFTHLELFKKRVNLPNQWEFPLFFEAGSAGVDFFFVLSGFLITVLLLNEKFKTGTINIKNFYIRRVLRIWPLYYLVLIMGLIVVPFVGAFDIPSYSELIWINFPEKAAFSILLMPNVALAFFGELPYISPMWSIGVEEQFYIFWPIIILYASRNINTILVAAFSFVFIKAIFLLAAPLMGMPPEKFLKIKDFIVAARMECMGIGGIGAYLYFKKSRLISLLSGNLLAIFSAILIPVLMFFTEYMYDLHHIVFSMLFLIIILNSTVNSNTFINLENRNLYILGKISYGIYLLHLMCIGIVLYFMRKLSLWDLPTYTFNVIYYLTSIFLIIIVSYLSYYSFEIFFLRLKDKYSGFLTGDAVRRSV